MRRKELVANPLPAAAAGADTRRFGDPVEGWLNRYVEGEDEPEPIWCCLRERHIYYFAKPPKKSLGVKPLGYADLRDGAKLRDSTRQLTGGSRRSATTVSGDATASTRGGGGGAKFFGGLFSDAAGEGRRFTIREGCSLLATTLECESAAKYDVWVAEVEAAIDGRVHRDSASPARLRRAKKKGGRAEWRG